MLQLRPNCECCDCDLPPASELARICSFECTFCADCVETRLGGVCPNCGGGFVPRPIRPVGKLATYPPSSERVTKPHAACADARLRSDYGSIRAARALDGRVIARVRALPADACRTRIVDA